jgi:hypothetical protein
MTDIEKIRVERRKMEATIRDSVVKAFSDFQAATGAIPKGLSVEILSLEYMGGGPVEFVVGDVRAHVEV